MDYKKEFVKFMCDSGVLTFGEFTLKSGRKAPYFVNTEITAPDGRSPSWANFTQLVSNSTD